MATDFEGVAADHAATAGHARRDQLIATGVTRSAIRSADASRRWTNPHRGVYALTTDAATASPLKAQRSGMHIRVRSISADQRVFIEGLPVTSVDRTLADCARLLPRMQAVSCLDSAMHLGLVTLDDVIELRSLMIRKRQCVSGRRRLLEARVGAQSPLETRVRLRASDGGFPPDALRVPIRNSSGLLLGYGDFGYQLPDGSWLIVEADGRSVHELPAALLHDRRRQNSFLGANVTSLVRFTWADAEYAAYIPNVLGTALAKTGWRRNPRRP